MELIPGRLTIQVGDISLARTQAVVNAANTELWMGSGVAGALKARGGDQIEKEARAQSPIRPGGARWLMAVARPVIARISPTVKRAMHPARWSQAALTAMPRKAGT